MATDKKKVKKIIKAGPQGLPLAWPFDQRKTLFLFLGLAALLIIILYWRYFFGTELFIFDDVGSDTITLFYPNLVQTARYCREVGIPGWSFFIGLGDNNYPGVLLSPMHWVYIPMNEVSIAYSIAWVQAGIMFLTGFIFYRFLREALFSLPVSFIGAILYTFGGYLVVGSSWYGHSLVIFWMTLAFLGFELLLRKKNWWLFIIPFIMMLDVRTYFLVIFMVLYSFIRFVDMYGFVWKELIRNYLRIIICGVVAVLLALPFIGGQWHRFEYSPRVSGKVSYSEHLSAISPTRLASKEHYVSAFMRMISNDALGTANHFNGWKNYLEAPLFYIGLLSILLVFQFFALSTKRRRILYGSLLGLWLFMIIFPWFRFAFYGFAGDYYKGALSLFIPFTLLMAALYGLQEIVNGNKPSQIALILSLVIIIGLIWFPYHEPKVTIPQVVQLKATLFLVLYGILLFMIRQGSFRKYLLPAISIIVILEAGIFSWPALNDRGSMHKSDINNKKFHFDYSMEAMDYIHKNDPSLFYRTDKLYGSIKSGYNDGMVQDFFGSKMYQSHNHKNYVRFLDEMGIIDGSQEKNTRWLLGLSSNQYLHPLFSIKYLLTKENAQAYASPTIYDKVTATGDVNIYRSKYYMPFGIAFDHYIDYDDFKNVPADEKQAAIYQGVVIEDNQIPKNFRVDKLPFTSLQGSASALIQQYSQMMNKSMTMTYFNQKEIRGTYGAERPTVLFLSIPFDDGWKAKVDGVKTNLFQANIGFTGLYLETGNHNIDLYYEPPLSKTGWAGTLVALIMGFFIFRYKDQFWK